MDDKTFLELLLKTNNERLSALEKKVDSLSSKLFFYIGFASSVASILSFFLSKIFSS